MRKKVQVYFSTGNKGVEEFKPRRSNALTIKGAVASRYSCQDYL
jgi:hypothetical protein